jgi:hypothetical protein
LCWLVALIALAGSAAPARAAEPGWADLGRVWTWLETWMPWSVETGDQCAGIDPNGRCRGDFAADAVDQGLSIDPDGSATSDQGLWIDPDG